MEYLFIFLLQLAGSIDSLLEVVNFVAVISLIGVLLTYYTREAIYASDYTSEKEKQCIDNIKEMTKKICIFAVTIFLILCIIPTKQTLLLMGGTYLGKKAVNAVITDEKIKKIDEIINLQLDKYLKELKERN